MLDKLREIFFYLFKRRLNNKRIKKQNLSFPKPIIHYIIESSPWILEKLNLTCKYWFAKYHTVFVGNIFRGNNSRGTDYLLLKNDKFITESTLKKLQHLKLVITNTVSYTKWWRTTHMKVSMNKLPSYLQKVSYCRLTKLYIQCQDLSFDEWNLLTESNSIKVINLVVSFIRYKNNCCVSIEDLFLNLLKVTEVHFLLSPEHFSLQTAQKLIDIKFCFKFNQFHLGLIPATFDFQTFLTFAEKNGGLETLYGIYGEHFYQVFYLDNIMRGDKTENHDEALLLFQYLIYDTFLANMLDVLP